MCNSVWVGDLVCERIGELSAFLGGDKCIVWRHKNPFHGWDEKKDWKDAKLCLCPVDVEATLNRAALTWRRGDPLRGEDAMEYRVAAHGDKVGC